MTILPSLPGWFSGQTPGGESKTLGRADGGPAPRQAPAPGMPHFPALADSLCQYSPVLPMELGLRQALAHPHTLTPHTLGHWGHDRGGAVGPWQGACIALLVHAFPWELGGGGRITRPIPSLPCRTIPCDDPPPKSVVSGQRPAHGGTINRNVA
jgi:hypothetical protein